MKNESWYSVKAMELSGEISIYGEIGAFGITAKNFIDDLKLLGSQENITVHINSPGGEVFDGHAIYNALKNHPAKVTMFIDGAAFSIASVIAMAGDHVAMSQNAMIMIHDPWTYTAGNADNHRKSAEMLDKTKQGIITAYTKKTGMSTQEVSRLMSDETWFTADEALDAGMVDEITGALEIAAHFDLSNFKNAPEGLTDRSQMMTTKAVDKNEVLNIEKQRRSEIRMAFEPFKAHDGIQMLLDTCLDDFSITSSQASAKLLAKLGEGAEPLAGNVSMGNDEPSLNNFKAAATDALLIRNGINVENPNPAARDLQRMSVVNMAETLLKKHGMNTGSLNASEIIKNAFTHSTSDFPGLLANVAGKALMQGYDNEPGTHRIWTREVEVNDFKTQTRNQISEAPELDTVLENGEYESGTFGESSEQYQITTFGKMFSISRQALINDDLNAFTRLPGAFGASASRKEADVVYGVLTDNANMSDGAALFHATHNNLESAAALGITSLGSARKAMRTQTGLKGLAILNIVPRYLIVPAALETTAEQLLSSLVDPTKNNDTPNLQFIRSLTLVVDARLDADSTTAWYLAADYGQVDTIERAYLEGNRGVSYEERMGWEVDGMEVKARLDFAAKAIDWRGLIKNPGA